MTIYPGALWRPMPGQQSRPLRRKGRGVGFHVAVHRGPSIYDINLSTGNDAHLYVQANGAVEQNVDLDRQAWAGVDGNPSMIWVETEGGADPDTVNTELWTPQQLAALAGIARWAHDTEGVPLQLMPDSRPASRGIGTHRLGITHSRGLGAVPGWRIAGGESWSSHVGKECPGNAKVGQLPDILEHAQGDDMPTVKEIADEIWSRPVRDAAGHQLTTGAALQAALRNSAAAATDAAVARRLAESAARGIVLSADQVAAIATQTADAVKADIVAGYELQAVPKPVAPPAS